MYGRPTQFASNTGVGTTGRFLSSNVVERIIIYQQSYIYGVCELHVCVCLVISMYIYVFIDTTVDQASIGCPFQQVIVEKIFIYQQLYMAGRASHALCLAGYPMEWPSYVWSIICARPPHRFFFFFFFMFR